MSLANIIAREDECRRLEKVTEEETAQLVVLYGRRRVGKTFLVNEFFDGRFDFKITGVFGGKKEVQLRNFAEELSGHLNREVEPPKDWIAAFWMLRRYLQDLPQNETRVVFFDELPWLDTQQSGFLSAFEHFWNDFGCAQHNFILIVCGSATSWMSKNIAENKGGLFNRQTCSIFLKPFTLKDTEQYLIRKGMEWSRYDIAECYMILGGIPYYLSLLEPERSLAANIDNLLFRKRAELWNEFHQLYRTLFTNSEQHIKIVEALSTRLSGLTRGELARVTGLPNNGVLSEMLSNLENSGFIRTSNAFGHKKAGKIYQLCDYYSLFYFRFIRDNHGRDEQFWSHSYGSGQKAVWAGLTFEQVCRDHIPQIKRRIGIGSVLSEESTWSKKGDEDSVGAQIDLIIDRNDHVINLCEIKYSDDVFEIDKEYDQKLRNKREVFRNATGTKKTIQFIMVTTYDIRKNKYSSIVTDQVLLDDLFA